MTDAVPPPQEPRRAGPKGPGHRGGPAGQAARGGRARQTSQGAGGRPGGQRARGSAPDARGGRPGGDGRSRARRAGAGRRPSGASSDGQGRPAAGPPTSAAAATSPSAGSAALEATGAAIRANRRRAWLLSAVVGGVPGCVVGVVIGLLVDPVAGAVGAVVVAAAVMVVLSLRATALALRVVGGHRIDAEEQPRLANLVEGLCATCGVPAPGLWLVDDPVPNACALGRRPGAAVLVVTSGLLDRLGLIELEGVVAHELMHVKCHDTAVSELAVTALYPLALAGGRARLVQAAVGRGREYRADQGAASMVRYPPGLRAALEAMGRGPAPAPGSVFEGRRWAATRWVWIDPMVGADGDATAGEIDATSVRSAALAEW